MEKLKAQTSNNRIKPLTKIINRTSPGFAIFDARVMQNSIDSSTENFQHFVNETIQKSSQLRFNNRFSKEFEISKEKKCEGVCKHSAFFFDWKIFKNIWQLIPEMVGDAQTKKVEKLDLLYFVAKQSIG